MRRSVRVVSLLALLAALPAVAGEGTYAVLADWSSGESVAGTTILVASPTPHVLAFDADACHRVLLFDLLYTPDVLPVGADGVGHVELAYRFEAEVWQEGARVGNATTIARSGYGHGIGLVPEEGPAEVRFWLTEGADVSWEARLRGRTVIDDPACEAPL